jgi:hypothetical protein
MNWQETLKVPQQPDGSYARSDEIETLKEWMKTQIFNTWNVSFYIGATEYVHMNNIDNKDSALGYALHCFLEDTPPEDVALYLQHRKQEFFLDLGKYLGEVVETHRKNRFNLGNEDRSNGR